MRIFERQAEERPTSMVDAIAYVVVPYATSGASSFDDARADAIARLQWTIAHRAPHSLLVYERNLTTSHRFPFPHANPDAAFKDAAESLFDGVADDHVRDELAWLYEQVPPSYDVALEQVIEGIGALDAGALVYRLAGFISDLRKAHETRAADAVRADLDAIVADPDAKNDRGRIIERVLEHAPQVARARITNDDFSRTCAEALETGGYAFGRLLARAPSGGVLRRFGSVYLAPGAHISFRAVQYGERIPLMPPKAGRMLN